MTDFKYPEMKDVILGIKQDYKIKEFDPALLQYDNMVLVQYYIKRPCWLMRLFGKPDKFIAMFKQIEKVE